MSSDDGLDEKPWTCPHCGDAIGFGHDCDELPPAAGACPLCGESYPGGYVSHLLECPERED